MNLNKMPGLKNLGKHVAAPLSRAVCSDFCLTPFRLFDAYLSFLQGKGAGTGWDLGNEIAAAVANIHRQAPVVFDIGANIGDWTEALLKACPGAEVHMFEPSPTCQNAIRARGMRNANLIPCALGNENTTARLHFSSPTDGSASLHAREDSCFEEQTYETVEVKVMTLESFVREKGIDFIDFAKLDIEGHELFALQGAGDFLRRGRIGAISFEFGSGNINSRTFFKDFWKLLSESGYSIGRITPSGKLIHLWNYYEDLEYFRGVTNYVATLVDHPYRKS